MKLRTFISEVKMAKADRSAKKPHRKALARATRRHWREELKKEAAA